MRHNLTKTVNGIFKSYLNIFKNMENNQTKMEAPPVCVIKEGLASIKTSGKVFYNPVQEFNRDMSIAVLNVFASNYQLGKTNWYDENPIDSTNAVKKEPNIKYDDGLSILEALSATGLRSIRYAKEVGGVKEIIANDFSRKAVEDIKRNISDNNVTELVRENFDDATMLMYEHRKNQFDAIDLDPYGTPSIFLDSAVQGVKNGGLLLITATDMAVLAGNSPETCYYKYGAVSLRMKCCHEMALRILLQCIEAQANRYSRYIQPLLSISADFYIRVFVRVFTGPKVCKRTTSKLSVVYHCTGCDSFALQSLGIIRESDKHIKFGLPQCTGANKCEHCSHSLHLGGPIWTAPLHEPRFVKQLLDTVPNTLGTYRRIQGMLSVIYEELVDVPLYYTLNNLSSVLHTTTPPMMAVRSALLNSGYRVSFTHMHKTSIKTDAPARVIWDIMRCWEKKNPVSHKRQTENSPGTNILSIKPEKEYSFDLHSDANPESRKLGFVRFQENPEPYWGPGTRSTAMVGDNKMQKSRRNQGKRKREQSEESISG